MDLTGPRVLGQTLWAAFDCDGQGRFQGKLPPGTYKVTGVVRDPDTGNDKKCSYPTGKACCRT